MTDVGPQAPDLLDAEIAGRLRAYARVAVSGTAGAAVARRVASAYPRRRGLAGDLAWRLGGLGMDASAGRRATLVLVAALLIAVGVLALVAGGWSSRHDPRSLLFVRDGQLVAVAPQGDLEAVLGAGDQVAGSPDGLWIAVSRPRDGGANHDVWVMRRDGTQQREVGPSCRIDGPWSPDGAAILAICGTAFSVIDTAAPDVHALGGLQTWKDAISGTWSPDGSQIALAQKDSIVVVRADGTQSRVVSDERLAWLPRWSPDGTTIAYSTPEGIRLVRPDGTDDRVLAALSGSPCELAWAPDGRSIAFARSACPGSGSAGLVDVGSGTLQRLASPIAEGNVLDLAWSPDGGRLALVVGPDGCLPGLASLWLVERDGSRPSEVSTRADCGFAADSGPSW
jgi:dipeptidyl aminopeptidase/acylaminoacyl peptidase